MFPTISFEDLILVKSLAHFPESARVDFIYLSLDAVHAATRRGPHLSTGRAWNLCSED